MRTTGELPVPITEPKVEEYVVDSHAGSTLLFRREIEPFEANREMTFSSETVSRETGANHCVTRGGEDE